MEDLKAIRFVEGTKISHDYKDKEIRTFSYRELIDLKVPAIGIPCKQNNLVVIDIDVKNEQHKHDGRPWWTAFVQANNVPFTYCVRTRSGGYHIYFKLPVAIDPEMFTPPKQLAPGVDVKWNGWVGAPPSVGYDVLQGSIDTIADLPDCLLEEMSRQFKGGSPLELGSNITFDAHKPFTETQIADLRRLLTEIQSISSPTYAEWRDGLFSLKTGVSDQALLEELATLWTYNRNYQTGDEYKAIDIVKRSDSFGRVGPGTIFSLISQIRLREGVPTNSLSPNTSADQASPFSRQDILDRSKVSLKFDDKGGVRVEPSETNVAQIIGAMYNADVLFHDVRQDLFVFNGQVHTEESIANELTPILQSTAFGFGFEKIKRATIKAGIEVLLNSRRVDPHLKWLNTIKWDGVSRIEKFFPDYCNTGDSEYLMWSWLTVRKAFTLFAS